MHSPGYGIKLLGSGGEEVFSEAKSEIRGSISWKTRSHTRTQGLRAKPSRLRPVPFSHQAVEKQSG